MARLPQQLSWDMASDRWASMIEPILANPANSSIILKNVVLAVGTNVINHKLGRNLQGWKPTRVRSALSVPLYDAQDTNQTPQLTLILVSADAVSIDLEVF